MTQQTLTNQRSIDQLQTLVLTMAEDIKVLQTKVIGLQGLIKNHLQLSEDCPHKIRV